MASLLAELLAGNRAHVAAVRDRFEGLEHAQHPEAVTVTCSDSRVLGDHIWGNDELGRLFTVGNIGNRVVQRTAAGEVVSGDVLYPLTHTGTELAVVVGHTGCGAVTAAYGALTGGVDEPPGIQHCIDLLAPHLEAGVEALPAGLGRAAAINHLVEYNVDRQVEFLCDSDDVPDSVDVAGVVYDFQGAYDGPQGGVHVVNVGGEHDPATLREAHPDIAEWVERRWSPAG
ncbi:MAG: carbonic anhydrase [Halobacteriaceae archaeon]